MGKSGGERESKSKINILKKQGWARSHRENREKERPGKKGGGRRETRSILGDDRRLGVGRIGEKG